MKKMKGENVNILFITAEGFDTPNPNNQMAETMMREFTNRGNRVFLIQSHRKGINPDIPEKLAAQKNLKVVTIKKNIVDKTNFVRRYLADLQYAFQTMRIWRKIKNVDVIYLQSNPTIIFQIVLLKIFKKDVPVVYSIYDVFPGHARDIGVIKNNFVFEILRIIQKFCYKLSDVIVVQSKDMREKVVEQGVNLNKLYIVEPWYDVETTKEIAWENNKFVKKYNIQKDKFRVQFAGTIGYVFDYAAVLELAERLLENKDIEIQIVGDGTVKETFVKEAKRRKLTNIKFFPLQPVEIVPDVYSECDVCIIPLKKGVIGNGVPSKAGILMTCRRVIVSFVEKDSEYARMFSEYDMGIAVDIKDYDGAAEAVKWLKDNPQRRQQMIENAYRYSVKHYLSNVGISNMLNALKAAGKRSRH